MPGDRTQGLTQNLSRLLMAAGRYDEAVAVCRRLIEQRGADVSPYKLAETWIGWRGHTGRRASASGRGRSSGRRSRSTAGRCGGDDLRRTLATFERTP